MTVPSTAQFPTGPVAASSAVAGYSHATVYDAARVLRYEARCSCGQTFVEATEIDARSRLRKHQAGDDRA